MEWPPNVGPVKKSWLLYLIVALCAATATFFLPRVASRYFSRSPVPLKTVTTEGGGTVFEAPKTPALAKALKKGTAKLKVEERPVVTFKTETLPVEEAEKIPDVPPVAGADNTPRLPELAASSIVPPWRGDTHVRAYLMGDGRIDLTLDPQREKFFGMDLRNLELEAAVGMGGKQFEAAGAWYPLRLGNVFLGAKAEVWSDVNGTFRGAGTIRVRWTPFR